jgi:hypothetical protein
LGSLQLRLAVVAALVVAALVALVVEMLESR